MVGPTRFRGVVRAATLHISVPLRANHGSVFHKKPRRPAQISVDRDRGAGPMAKRFANPHSGERIVRGCGVTYREPRVPRDLYAARGRGEQRPRRIRATTLKPP